MLPRFKAGILVTKKHISSEKTTTLRGLTVLMFANLGWGLCDVLIAYVSRGQFTTWFHGVTGTIVLGTILLFQGKKFSVQEFKSAFPLGLQRAAVWTVLFYAFQEGNPTIAITILSFSSVLAIIIFSKYLNEKPTLIIYMSALFGTVGVILASLKSLDSFVLTTGAILSLIILPVSSAGPFIVRKVQNKVPADKSAFYMYVWVSIIITFTLPFANITYSLTTKEIWIFALMALVGAGGHLLYNLSQKQTSFIVNIIVSNIHIPATAILSYILIDKSLNVHQIVGILIIVAVVAFVSIKQHERKPKEPMVVPVDI